ncbi:hypothetical protein [Winogradskyella sp.]|uniref:hypothetical protein n=1 Tax=Winogradskyella sp. TaxID=1883156 RepID=UPI00261FB798|nr:hypothetical protein [Winogradskyella sp.]
MLYWSNILCNIIIVVNIFMFALLLLIVVSSFFTNKYSNYVALIDGVKAGFGTTNLKFISFDTEKVVVLSSLTSAMKIWFILRNLVFTVIIIKVILIIKKVVKSIKSLNTFYMGNIAYFKHLAILGWIGAFFSAFNFLTGDEDYSMIHFTIPFGPIAFAIACLILSHVFDEGKSLLDDKNSIV